MFQQFTSSSKYYGEMSVYDCMIPLKNLLVVDITVSFDELLKEMGYDFKDEDADDQNPSKFALVYHNNTDKMVGVVYSKDVIFRLSNLKSKKDGCDFLFSPLVYAPFIMNIKNAIELMDNKKTPVLLVVNNKGGTLGIVNKESIIDFVYNYETVKDYFEKHSKDGQIVVDGSLLLKHIPQEWFLNVFEDCYKAGTRTIGGFLGYYTGVIPALNSETIIDNFSFKILEGNERYIKTILISKMNRKLHDL